MKRLRWFSLQWNGAVSELVRSLASDAYTHESRSGFHLERANKSELVGSYVERHHYSEELTDPNGEVFVGQYIEIKKIDFRIDKASMVIELTNPPAGVATLLGKLAHHSGYTLSASAMELDLFKWISSVSGQFDGSYVSEIQTSEIQVGKEVHAKCQIAGTQDVLRYVDNVLRAKVKALDRAKVRIPAGAETCSIEVRAKGTLVVPDSLDDDDLAVLRNLTLDCKRSTSP